MYTSETLQALSERLFRENICTVPLNEKALQTVAEFMHLRNANSELMRRLSNVELNYVQIRSEAEESCREASLAKDAITASFRSLVDNWGRKGYLTEFMFSFKQEAADDMRSDLSFTIEAINANINLISRALMTLGETSAQMRACSASFMEIYNESKLAIYASMLNRDKEDVLDCRAISLQSHASSNESNRTSAHYLGIAKNCTRIIAIINLFISESANALYSEGVPSYRANLLSPAIISNKISEVIRNLEYISIENN